MKLNYLLCALLVGVVSDSWANQLLTALNEAEKIDPTLATSIANRDAGEEGVSIARSRLLPQLSAQANHSRTNQDVDRVGAATSNYKVNATNSQLYLKQALLRPRDWAGLSISQLQAEYTNNKLASAYSDLWLRVINGWLDVLSASELVKIHSESVVAMRYVAAQARKSFQAGSGTKDAAAEAEAQLEVGKANLADAQLSLDSRRRIYKSLTGVEAPATQQFKMPSYKQLSLNQVNHADFYQKVLDVSPDLAALRAGQGVRKLQIDQAKYDNYPVIDLVSSYSKTNNDNINQIGTKVNSSAIGVQISIPIFSGGGMVATERQAVAYYQAASSDLKANELRIKNDIDITWASQKSLIEQMEASSAMVSALKERLRSAKMGLGAGVKSWADLGNAQIALSRNQAEHARQLIAYVKGQTKLLSQLPISEEFWTFWVNQLSEQTVQSK